MMVKKKRCCSVPRRGTESIRVGLIHFSINPEGLGQLEPISTSHMSSGRSHWPSAPRLSDSDSSDLPDMVTQCQTLGTPW